MKKYVFLLLVFNLSFGQSNDSISLLKSRLNYESDIISCNEILNGTMRSLISKNENMLSIEKKIGIGFYNIESLLMVYSASSSLKLSETDIQEMNNFMKSLSNELILKQFPSSFDLNSDKQSIKKIPHYNAKAKTRFNVNLISFNKNEFIIESKVKPLLDAFNSNTQEKINQ